MPVSIDSDSHPAVFTPDSRAAWARLGIALIIGSIGSVGMWSVVVVIPIVQADFGATRGAASLAFTCTMLGFGLGGVAMGKLSDRFGIVPAIAIGIVAMLLGYVGAGYAAALWQFNLMHFLIGLGAAATFGPLMTRHRTGSIATAGWPSPSPPAEITSQAHSGPLLSNAARPMQDGAPHISRLESAARSLWRS